MEEEVFRAQVAPLEAHVQHLTDHLQLSRRLHQDVDAVLGHITTMRSLQQSFGSTLEDISSTMNSIQDEKDKLEKELSHLRSVLRPFNLLDDVSRTLNSGSVDITAASDCLNTLAVAAVELESAGSAVRDLQVYVHRLQQLRSRALGALRTHIITRLRAAYVGAAAALQERPPGGTYDTSGSQLSFHAIAPSLRPLIVALENNRGSTECVVVLLYSQRPIVYFLSLSHTLTFGFFVLIYL